MHKIENIQNFYVNFKCEDDCKRFLFNLKWQEGFVCIKCGNTKSWKGKTNFHQRCASCNYDESCTANTIFHKIKFPLLKAFAMLLQIAVPKKGRSTVDLAKEFGMFQPTAWLFKSKVQKTMGADISAGSEKLMAGKRFSIDSIIITHRGEELNGFQRVDLYLNEHPQKGERKLLISSNWILPQSEGRETSKLVNGQFKEFRTNLLLWNFKNWLTGIHHHCALNYLKGYLDEFFFKHNYRNEREMIWLRIVKKSLSGRRDNKELTEL